MKITAHSLTHGPDCVRIGDMVYLPPRRRVEIHKANRAISKIVREQADLRRFLTEEVCQTIESAPIVSFPALSDHYEHYRLTHQGAEPEWIRFIPLLYAREMRTVYAATEGFDPMAVVSSFPYQGFGYIVLDEGMIPKVCDALNIGRLHQVRQLSYLHDQICSGDRHSIAMEF